MCRLRIHRTMQYTFHRVCVLYSVHLIQCTSYTVLTVYTVHSTVYSGHYTLYSIQYTVDIIHCTVYMYTIYSMHITHVVYRITAYCITAYRIVFFISSIKFNITSQYSIQNEFPPSDITRIIIYVIHIFQFDISIIVIVYAFIHSFFTIHHVHCTMYTV